MSIGSGYIVFSDIYQLDNIVRNTAMMAGRNLIIDILREIFRRDSEYHYVTDKFGFPKTPRQLGLSSDDGRANEKTTRIYIGGTHREDTSFFPAVTVRPSSLNYFPISLNQNEQTVKYGFQKIVDGYGNQTIVNSPIAAVYAGAWEQSFEIKVMGRSNEDVLSIADLIAPSLQNTFRTILMQNGLFIKNLSISGIADESIGEADPIYSVSITINTFSEWRREIPIANLVDRIQLCFAVDASPNDVPASKLGINIDLD